MAKRRGTMGDAVDDCIRIETEEWFRQNGGYRTREEAFTNDVRLVSATCERRRGGFLRVHIGIVTGDRRTTTTNMYDFQLRQGLGYVPKENGKSKA